MKLLIAWGTDGHSMGKRSSKQSQESAADAGSMACADEPCAMPLYLQASAANKKKSIRTSWSIGFNKAVAQVWPRTPTRFGTCVVSMHSTVSCLQCCCARMSPQACKHAEAASCMMPCSKVELCIMDFVLCCAAECEPPEGAPVWRGVCQDPGGHRHQRHRRPGQGLCNSRGARRHGHAQQRRGCGVVHAQAGRSRLQALSSGITQ